MTNEAGMLTIAATFLRVSLRIMPSPQKI